MGLVTTYPKIIDCGCFGSHQLSQSHGVTMIPDKRLVWHPRRYDEFVVGGGTQITLYGLAREYPEIRQLASRNDLHHMRVRH